MLARCLASVALAFAAGCAESVIVTLSTRDFVSGEASAEVLVDTDAPIQTVVELYVGDRRVGRLDQIRPYRFTWQTSQFSDGPAELRAVVGGGGIEGEASHDITIDNTPPALEVSSTYPFAVSVTDSFGVDDLVIDLPGNRRHCSEDGRFTLEFESPTCGPVDMALTAIDAAANETRVERELVLEDDDGCLTTAVTATPVAGCGEPEETAEPECELLPGGLDVDAAVDGVSFGFVDFHRPLAGRYEFVVGDFSVMLRGDSGGDLVDHQQARITRNPDTRLWHLDYDEMSVVFLAGDDPPTPLTLALLLDGGLRVACTGPARPGSTRSRPESDLRGSPRAPASQR